MRCCLRSACCSCVVAGGAPYAQADTSPPTVRGHRTGRRLDADRRSPGRGDGLERRSGSTASSSPYFDGATGQTFPLGTDYVGAVHRPASTPTKVPNTAPLDADRVRDRVRQRRGESQQHTKVGNGVTVSNAESGSGSRRRATRSSPATLSLRLGTGTTTDVPATLHFAKLPPKADILLAFDTTGSMGAAITRRQERRRRARDADPERDPERALRGRGLQGLRHRRDQQPRRPGRLPVARRPRLHRQLRHRQLPNRSTVHAEPDRLRDLAALRGRRRRPARGVQPCLLRGVQRHEPPALGPRTPRAS